MYNNTLSKLKRINKKWEYLKENIVRDEIGRKNYTRHVFYLDIDSDPTYIINQFRDKVEVVNNVLLLRKNEEALLSLFANSLIGGK